MICKPRAVPASELKPGMKSRNLVMNKMDMRYGQYVMVTIENVRPAVQDLEVPAEAEGYLVVEFTSDVRDENGASYGLAWCRHSTDPVDVY